MLGTTACIEMDGATTRLLPRDATMVSTEFTFDASFWSHDGFENDGDYFRPLPGSDYADQAHVFETFGKRLLDSAWAGHHCCLLAHGPSGAGKSYSMVGYGKNKGIIP